jgi:hypothetical protein
MGSCLNVTCFILNFSSIISLICIPIFFGLMGFVAELEYVAYAAIGVFIITYVANLICVYASNNYKYLSNRKSLEEISELIEAARKAYPVIRLHVRCWHKERRTRRVRDSQGNYRTETYYVNVTTYRGSRPFIYKSWRDITDSQSLNHVKTYLRIHLADRIEADQITREAIREAERKYRRENMYRDQYCDVHTTYKIYPDVTRYFMIGPGDSCFTPKVFGLTGFLCVNWAYQIMFDRISTNQVILIRKLVTIKDQDIFQQQIQFVPMYTAQIPSGYVAPQVAAYNPQAFTFAPQPAMFTEQMAQPAEMQQLAQPMMQQQGLLQ